MTCNHNCFECPHDDCIRTGEEIVTQQEMRNAYMREWHRNHPGKQVEYNRRYREKHREKVNERAMRRYYEKKAAKATEAAMTAPNTPQI